VLTRGGAREVALFGERHEVPELPQFHKQKLYINPNTRLGLLEHYAPLFPTEAPSLSSERAP
jgi:hypothetical protein